LGCGTLARLHRLRLPEAPRIQKFPTESQGGSIHPTLFRSIVKAVSHESAFKREADLRRLQDCAPQGRRSRDLLVRSQAQAGSGLSQTEKRSSFKTQIHGASKYASYRWC
jgi:hypothetical protein